MSIKVPKWESEREKVGESTIMEVMRTLAVKPPEL
jgi:hypothetical protein